jgi:hypothetical protein
MPRLDELAHNWGLFEAAIEAEGGELTDSLAARFDLLSYEERTKVDRTVLYLKGLEGESEKWKELETEMAAKRKSCERRIEWLKGLVKRYMTERQSERIEGDVWRFQLVKSGKPPVEVLVPPEELPRKFQKISVEADKEALRVALTLGPPPLDLAGFLEINGATVARLGEATQSLRIY